MEGQVVEIQSAYFIKSIAAQISIEQISTEMLLLINSIKIYLCILYHAESQISTLTIFSGPKIFRIWIRHIWFGRKENQMEISPWLNDLLGIVPADSGIKFENIHLQSLQSLFKLKNSLS